MSATSPVRPGTRRLELENLEDRCVPAVATTNYLRALYSDLLHRTPSSSELAGWAGAMASGITPAQVALAFATGAEHSRAQVVADYNRFLNRSPSPQEVTTWVGQLQAGMTEQEMQATMLGSSEFFAQFGNNTSAWLNEVYRNVLGRDADAPGLAAWSQALGGSTRAAVALSIIQSQEGAARMVADLYGQLLRRGPDSGGLAAWETQLMQGLGEEQMVAAIASSPEYLALALNFTA